MYSVMVIDDNHLSVEGICQNIDWKSMKACVTHRKYDGISALKVMEEEHIDLIISDIEMPQMSGLELSEQAVRKNPHVKIILISVFDKFEYARQAVRLGAFDYVEKPIDYGYLADVAKKALSLLARENEKRELLKRSRPAMTRNFLQELLRYPPDEAKLNLSSYLDYLSLDINCHFYQVSVIRAGNAKELKKQLGVEEYQVRLMNLQDEYQEAAGQFRFFHMIGNLEGMILIKGHNHANKKDFHQMSDQIHTGILTNRRNDMFDLNIGVGSIEKDIFNLKHSYENASKALEYSFFFPQKNLFDIRDIKGRDVPRKLLGEKEEDQLIQLICKKDEAGVKEWIQNFSESLLSSYQAKPFVFIRIYSILGKIVRFLCEMDIDTKDIEREIIRVYNQLDKFTDSRQIFLWLEGICRAAFEKLEESVQGYHEQICACVVSYIGQHYHESGLNLNDIAAHVNVSPAHLSALFKKYQGINISDMITGARMDAACQMLIHTNLPLKEISEKIGYTNQYYFSSCFKKNLAQSPSVYREKNRR